MTRAKIAEGALVLANGDIFEGDVIGAIPADGISSGEVVFNTVLSGYQEVIRDPSYAGQILTFTYPHIGNYGTTPLDNESTTPATRGVIIRELARRPSNWRNEEGLPEMLARLGIAGIAGVDTRRLTRVLRDVGAMPGAFGTAPESDLLAAAKSEPGTSGLNLVETVSTPKPYSFGTGKFRVVAYDFGIKTTILRCLGEIATVEVVPWSESASDVLGRKPDGVFLSNGPGDPEMVPNAPNAIRALVDSGVPVFGICLGHQLLSLAMGGHTFKLPFGHHGGNHPVRNLRTCTVEITSQNHNYCVDADSLSGVADITHVNLNDQTNEGMKVRDSRAFSVQYHPEAGPGPHDSRYLFAEFAEMMKGS